MEKEPEANGAFLIPDLEAARNRLWASARNNSPQSYPRLPQFDKKEPNGADQEQGIPSRDFIFAAARKVRKQIIEAGKIPLRERPQSPIFPLSDE